MSKPKIHYHQYYVTMESQSKTACGRVKRPEFTALKDMSLVTCKACLRALWALGNKAKRRLNKIAPMYSRVKE